MSLWPTPSDVVSLAVACYFTWKQARNDRAMHRKLDEMVRAVPEADNAVVELEKRV